MDKKHVKIFLPATANNGGYVEIDGVRQKNVRAVSVHGGTDCATSVTLELTYVEVEIETEVDDVARIIDVTDIDSVNREYRRA